MASYFATVLEDKVSVATAVPQNTKKEIWLVIVYWKVKNHLLFGFAINL